MGGCRRSTLNPKYQTDYACSCCVRLRKTATEEGGVCSLWHKETHFQYGLKHQGMQIYERDVTHTWFNIDNGANPHFFKWLDRLRDKKETEWDWWFRGKRNYLLLEIEKQKQDEPENDFVAAWLGGLVRGERNSDTFR